MHHRYISDPLEIDEIILQAEVCYVGMTEDDGTPYVLPFNFGYQDGILFLHSSKTGHKIDLLSQRPKVCAVFSCGHQLRYQSEQVACSYSMKYKSVQMFGEVQFVKDAEAKIEALDRIMAHYTQRPFTYNAPSIREVCVYTLKPDRVSARLYGY